MKIKEFYELLEDVDKGEKDKNELKRVVEGLKLKKGFMVKKGSIIKKGMYVLELEDGEVYIDIYGNEWIVHCRGNGIYSGDYLIKF